MAQDNRRVSALERIEVKAQLPELLACAIVKHDVALGHETVENLLSLRCA
jgi:hypothetical protein